MKNKIYIVGDSIPFGYGSIVKNLIPKRLNELVGTDFECCNASVGGRRAMRVRYSLKNDVISKGDAKYCIVLCGINDLTNIPIRTDKGVKANLQKIYNKLHEAEIKVVACTIIPFKGAKSWTPKRQKYLESINKWILREAKNVDYVVDSYTALEDPKNKGFIDPACDYDHIHLNTHGQYVLANEIYRSVKFKK